MEPLGVGLTVPFEIDARIDAKTELGARIPFVGCVEYASDRYNATGSADGTAEIAIALDLNVDTRTTADGNLLVILDPQVEVVTALGDFELDLDISGQNPLVQAGAFIAGITVLRVVLRGSGSNRVRPSFTWMDQQAKLANRAVERCVFYPR